MKKMRLTAIACVILMMTCVKVYAVGTCTRQGTDICFAESCTYTPQELIANVPFKTVPFFNTSFLQTPPKFNWLSQTLTEDGISLHVEAQVECSTAPCAGHVRLFYSYDFSITSSVDPAWHAKVMTKKQNTANIYEADFPLSAVGTASYYGEATDCFNLSTKGIYNSVTVQNRAPYRANVSSFPSWTTSNLVGEMSEVGFPLVEEALTLDQTQALNSDLDIQTFRVKHASFGGAENLFFELRVAGQITGGTSGLDFPNAYAIFIQSLDRPDDPSTPVPEGLFALLYFPNYAQTAIIKHRAEIIDLEKTYQGYLDTNGSVIDLIETEAFSSVSADGKSLSLRVPLSALNVVPRSTANGYEQGAFLMTAATGNSYELLPSVISFCFGIPVVVWLDSLDFNQDMTNVVKFQTKNMKKWPEN